MMFSIVVPVYQNEFSIAPLLSTLDGIVSTLDEELEVVFVVDGSPDQSYLRLREAIPGRKFKAQLIQLSKNFGAFAAIRAGLIHARGSLFAVMAADLQEPPELIKAFFDELRNNAFDVVVGVRIARNDPLLSRFASSIFWKLYRKLINRDIPEGGVDIFGCNDKFRKALLSMEESNSSLIGLLFWLGFRRKTVGYERREREVGKSAWTFSKKLKYLSDSIFAFSDLPIKALVSVGMLGIFMSIAVSLLVLLAKVFGMIHVPGYTATVLIVAFFAALNLFGLGIIGTYVWRVYENTKSRPLAVVMTQEQFN